MTKDRIERIKKNGYPNKRIKQLAENDYVEPTANDIFCDSDILAPQGVTVRDSNQEARDDSVMLTYAKYEQELNEARQDTEANAANLPAPGKGAIDATVREKKQLTNDFGGRLNDQDLKRSS